MPDEEWRAMLDKSGRVLAVKKLHERIFRGVGTGEESLELLNGYASIYIVTVEPQCNKVSIVYCLSLVARAWSIQLGKKYGSSCLGITSMDVHTPPDRP